MVRLGRAYPATRIVHRIKVAAAPAGPTYDAIGAGFPAALGSSIVSWSHTATAGAEAFVFAAANVGAPTAQYGSTAMTINGVSAPDPNGVTLYLFTLSNVTGGAQTVTVTNSSGGVVPVGNSISVKNVTTVGTPATTQAAASQSVSCTGGQFIVQSFNGAYGALVSGAPITAYSGGTGRWLDANGGMTISTATATTTFTETDAASGANLSSLAVVLS